MASESRPRSGRSPLPVVVAATALVLARTWLLRRRRAAPEAPQKPSEWLAARSAAQPASASPGKSPADAEPPAAAPGAHGARAAAARAAALAAASTAAVAAVVLLLCLRGSPDLAVAVALAWALNLLQLKAPAVGGAGPSEAAAAAAPAPPQRRARMPDLAGTWVKDHRASDSMEPIMDVMRMNGLLRGAVRLLRGLEIKLDGETFSFAVFSVVKWFKVAETYPLDGRLAASRRRDLRGKMRGSVRLTQHGTLLVAYEWDAPLAGHGEDEFVVSEGRLLVITTNWVDGQEVKYTQVYVRR